ncbi:MAG: sporulation initiation factor Spo0A C-terminal domain-containing protein [bacterium]|nr:sporulation initiation factor Spo0A C-terminal domain-containing protein [bacterium]
MSTPPCSVDRYLYSLFLQLGIPANKRGFHHLREAVKLALEEPTLQHHLMHGLYPKVAKRFGTTVCCVERSIRTAITSAWNRGRPDLIEKHLGRGVITPYEKPTNGEMISLIAENVRLLIQEGKL